MASTRGVHEIQSKAGRQSFFKISARHTSQESAGCGRTLPDNCKSQDFFFARSVDTLTMRLEVQQRLLKKSNSEALPLLGGYGLQKG